MVDLTGKFYTLDELDETFVKERVNVELYKEYAGRFVKNAYDPNLTDQDETLDISICMMMKANNLAFKTNRYFTTRWIAGLFVLPLAKSV